MEELPQRSLIRTATKCLRRYTTDGALPKQTAAAFLAMLHIATDTEFQNVKVWPVFIDGDLIGEPQLAKLPAARMQLFAEFLLNLSPANFQKIQQWIKSGQIRKPKTNSYVAALISQCSWKHKNSNGLKRTLSNYPDFLTEDVWLLFEFEGTAESCLAGADKYLTNNDESWNTVMVAFANEGGLDRERLLKESLRAMTKDMNQFRVGWFSRFHEALEPTVEERQNNLQAYFHLLRSPIPFTVTIAVNALLVLSEKNKLTFAELDSVISPGLGAKTKSTVSNTLRVLENCVRHDKDCHQQVSIRACEALFSSNAEVQKQSKTCRIVADYQFR